MCYILLNLIYVKYVSYKTKNMPSFNNSLLSGKQKKKAPVINSGAGICCD